MPAGKRQEKGMEILLNLLKLKSYKQLMNDFFLIWDFQFKTTNKVHDHPFLIKERIKLLNIFSYC